MYPRTNGLPRNVSMLQFPSNHLLDNLRHEPSILPESRSMLNFCGQGIFFQILRGNWLSLHSNFADVPVDKFSKYSFLNIPIAIVSEQLSISILYHRILGLMQWIYHEFQLTGSLYLTRVVCFWLYQTIGFVFKIFPSPLSRKHIFWNSIAMNASDDFLSNL